MADPIFPPFSMVQCILPTSIFLYMSSPKQSVSPVASYLKEIVYGGNDGIVTTFAVVSGFAGASQGNTELVLSTVLLFGCANLLADATSMGLGNYLSERSERDVYIAEKNKETYEIVHEYEEEWQETVDILRAKGYEEEDARAMADLYAKNKEYWAEFMMRFELDMDKGSDHPILNAFATFLSFSVFGAIPLLPYVFFPNAVDALFFYSCIATAIALLSLGVLRWAVTKISLVRSVAEAFLIGTLASLIAYTVGTLF